jgi:soluble lytic murein transglycosylase
MKKRKEIYYLKFIPFLLILSFLFSNSFAMEEPKLDDYKLIIEAKKHLDNGDHSKAIALLNESIEKYKIFEDYLLFWRAKAYENIGDLDRAISDLKKIKETYKDSLIIKKVRLKEIELHKMKNSSDYIGLLESFITDYPQDLNIKFTYGKILKDKKEVKRAKALFKEIFISSSPLSIDAMAELSPSDITAEDLLKRGENLNNAWLFKEAENCLKDALKKKPNNEIKKRIINALAYSLFRQKKYKEAAILYKDINNPYWRARSLIRANDLETFESELETYLKVSDNRIVKVLLSYGTKKRRQGDIEKALDIFYRILKKYPSEKEDILWTIGWTYYISGEYKKAMSVFSELYNMFKNSQYLYWTKKCEENINMPSSIKSSLQKGFIEHRDYYGYLLNIKTGNENALKNNIPFYRETEKLQPIERIEILINLGMFEEAKEEILNISRKTFEQYRLIQLSNYLKKLGAYKASIGIFSKLRYVEDFHPYLYPLVYLDEIETSSKENGIDPLLVLSIIREESRFDKEARSIAGALGLMQLMPGTAKKFQSSLDIKLNKTEQLYEPKTNIAIGTFYLKKLITMFNSVPAAIAAYNAGEEAVKNWLNNHDYKTVDEFIEDIPYDETRNYVKNVLTTYFEYSRINDHKTTNFDILSNIKL